MSTKEERREMLMSTIDDGVSNLLYYDRKEDDEMPRGSIEDMVAKGEVTVAEMVSQFETSLTRGLGLVKVTDKVKR